jgi:hypothetical protein
MVKPSDAINSLIDAAASTVLACDDFAHLVLYKTLLDDLGEDKFNQVFKTLVFSSSDYVSHMPLYPYLTSCKVEDSDYRSFEITQKDTAHPTSTNRGYHALQVGKDLLIGLGFEGITNPDAIKGYLIAEYNSPPTDIDCAYAKLGGKVLEGNPKLTEESISSMSLQLNPRYLNFIKTCTPEELDKFQAFWKDNARALLLNLDPTLFEEIYPVEFKLLSMELNDILNGF